MAVFEFDTEHCVWKGLYYGPFQYDCVFFCFCDRNFLLLAH